MRGINSNTVDLIYLDPPFNSARNYAGTSNKFLDDWNDDNLSQKLHGYDVLSSLRDAQVLLKQSNWWEMIALIKRMHSSEMYNYVSFMAIRIIEMHRILKSTGSLYLHCDDSSNSYLRQILDFVFGHKNGPGADGCGAEIIWKRSDPKNNATKNYGRVFDSIYCYRKTKDFTHNTQYLPISDEAKSWYKYDDGDGRGLYNKADMSSPQHNDNNKFRYKGFPPPRKGWRYTLVTMKKLDAANLLAYPKDKNGRIMRKRYLNDSKGIPVGNLWTHIKSIRGGNTEQTGWATQKPLELLRQIIKTSSNPEDIVFDPFAGCATTMIAAHQCQRRHIGAEIDPEICEILVMRCKGQPDILYNQDIVVSYDLPVRSDNPNAK